MWCSCGVANRTLARFCRGCGTELRRGMDWRLSRGSAASSAFLPLVIPFLPPMRELRRFHLGARLTGQFVYSYGHLFFPVQQDVVVLREYDCMEVALIRSRSTVVREVGVVGDKLLIAGDGGLEAVPLLGLLTRGGAQPVLLFSSPVAPGRAQLMTVLEARDRVVVIGDTAVYGVGLQDRRLAWSVPRHGRGAALVVKAGEGVVVAEESGDCWGLTSEGEVRWHRQLKQGTTIRAGMASWEHKVYLLGGEGSLLMLHADLGRLVPTIHQFTRPTGLACNDRYAYISTGHGLKRCSPAESTIVEMGAEQPLYAAPVVTNGTVFVGTGHGALLCADTYTERHVIKSGVAEVAGVTPVLTGPRIHLASELGEVVTFSLGGDGGTQ